MRMRGYPRWFYRILLLILLALLVTGLLLVPSALELRLEWEVPWRLGGDVHIGTTALHALMAFLTATAMGALWSVHMRAGWRHGKNHRSGLMMVVLMALLLISAVGIYYLADDALSRVASVIHMAAGLLVPLLLVYHMLAGWRIRRVH